MIVPNSGGTSQPRFKAPADACDCHAFIYNARYPMAWTSLPMVMDASVDEYRMLQQRIGTTRVVVVQPAAYGTDNRGILDAIARLGPDRARGVAIAHPTIGDDELAAMNRRGIRGLRFSLHDPHTAITSAEMIEPLARRVRDLGWHVQLHLRGEQIAAMAPMLEALPGTVVIDHMGRLPQPEGAHHEALAVMKRLLDSGRGWVKLSGAYLDSRTGSPRYSDLRPVAKVLVTHCPERLVWGSDWPHPTERHTKPDDAVLLDLLQEWVADEATRRHILVTNPARLYGF
ncbi:MAG TPA: amidohydrolase family protein [Usitatibacter sp.]|nr:amidohydrolase family protein [Usitatibacter sp.]